MPRDVTGMGAAQAEYQGCLCNPMEVDSFLHQALKVVLECYENAHLKMRHLDFGRYSPVVHDALAKQANVIVRQHGFRGKIIPVCM